MCRTGLGRRHLARIASLTCINTGVCTNYQWNILVRSWWKRWISETRNLVITQQIFELLTRYGQPVRQAHWQNRAFPSVKI
jgi:hypothetical protein